VKRRSWLSEAQWSYHRAHNSTTVTGTMQTTPFPESLYTLWLDHPTNAMRCEWRHVRRNHVISRCNIHDHNPLQVCGACGIIRMWLNSWRVGAISFSSCLLYTSSLNAASSMVWGDVLYDMIWHDVMWCDVMWCMCEHAVPPACWDSNRRLAWFEVDSNTNTP